MKNVTGHQEHILYIFRYIYILIYKAIRKTRVQNEQALAIMLRKKGLLYITSK